MSHQTVIKSKITDRDALLAACAELGLQVNEDAYSREYAGRSSAKKHELVIVSPGKYDVAANKAADGTYELSTDWWSDLPQGGSAMQKVVGKDYCKLTQIYGIHKATKEAKKLGYFTQRTTNAAGQPRLVVTSAKF